MNDTSSDSGTPLRKVVDSSGFPFQLAVEQLVRAHKLDSGSSWTVVAEFAAEGGFVDLIASMGYVTLVIECKRLTSASWIFLTKPGQPENVARCRLAWRLALKKNGRTGRVFVDEWTQATGSVESGFCAIQKSSGLSPETLASNLIAQCQSLTEDDRRSREYGLEVVVPIIVTSAALHTCEFAPGQVNPLDGTIPSNSVLKPVPFIRFRKSFTREPSIQLASTSSYKEAALDFERTVFVVNIEGLSSFLHGFRALRPADGFPAPRAYREALANGWSDS